MLVVAALDGGRFRWSRVPVGGIIGFGLVAAYMALNMWAAREPFLSAAARVQADQGHHVSPQAYRFVRHPMYLGLCLLAAGVPLSGPVGADRRDLSGDLRLPHMAGGSVLGGQPARLCGIYPADALPADAGPLVS
jgi:protein-S-isoprenylcysteine O-methyltransferase Ste14